MQKTDYDILIVGSGPAGATTARIAAQAGLKTLLIDKKQELGAPIQCSGALSRHALLEVGLNPDREYIQTPIYGFGIYNQVGALTEIDYRHLKPEEYGPNPDQIPLGYVVDRRRFDRHLMRLAQAAGAEVWLKTEGLGYEPLQDGTCKVQVRRYQDQLELNCKVLIGADGLQSQVGRWGGLRTHIKLPELASCLQFVVDQVETHDLLEIITGHQWAPGGYAWVFPKQDGLAEIGLGVARNMTEHNAQWHLEYFMKESFFKKRFERASILEVQGGGVPLASPLKRQYADNLLLVGDAARHVNPITGGGIHTALNAGKVAAEFLARLLQNDHKPTAANLAAYQEAWMANGGEKMWQLYREKSRIFRIKRIPKRDEELYKTMSDYFSPDSQYKKI